MSARADIGVFGGSGFYSFLDDAAEVVVDTPYGPTAAPVVIGSVGTRRVAFLPRHGRSHEYPPHAIPYRANVWAMRELGVARVLAPTAAGSLQPRVARGDLVVCDQIVDRTSGRAASFFDGPSTVHVSLADPYCPQLRGVCVDRARASGMTVHEHGTCVVIEGPRFSSRAESAWYSSMGWEVINMTQYPEVALAREAELCYANISLITDYDAGVEASDVHGAPVSVEEVVSVFKENTARLRDLLLAIVEAVPDERTCACGSALQGARVSG